MYNLSLKTVHIMVNSIYREKIIQKVIESFLYNPNTDELCV